MTKIKIYLKALRLPFSLLTVLTYVLLWASLKLPYERLFFISLFALILAHLSANLWNDYFDQEADNLNNGYTVFSGGSRILQKKLLSTKEFFIYSLLLSILTLFLALVLLYYSDNPLKLLMLLLLTAALLFFYTAPPFKFVYRGLGEPIIFLTFGPLISLGIVFLTGKHLEMKTFLISCIMGLLTARVLFVNEISDYEFDKRSLKKNWVVLLGFENSKKVMPCFSILALSLCLFIIPLILFLLILILLSFFEFIAYKTKKKEVRSLSGLLEAFVTGIILLIRFSL